jgi:drug/metabolite transporter (DMT)-like permease
VLVTLGTSLLVLAIFVAFDPPDELNGTALAMFAAAGLAAPGVSRWATNTGTHLLGPSISGSITQGTRPLLAVAGGVLLLNESLSLREAAAIVLIVAGGYRLTRAIPEDVAGEAEVDVVPDGPRFRPGLVFPLLAGLGYAIQDVVNKEALSQFDDARFGAFVGMSTGFGVWALATLALPRLRAHVRVGQDLGWLVVSGVLGGLAAANLFAALSKGDVTVVSPIVATQPLVVFSLSRLLLRHLESLSAGTVLAGVGIVVGTITISL